MSRSDISFKRSASELAIFLGTAVGAVDRGQQLRLVDHCQFNTAFQDARDFIVGEQVGRVGHADQQRQRAIFQHDGAETARLRFWQEPHRGRIGVEELEIDVGDVELLGDGARNLLFADEGVFDEDTAQLAAGTLLLGKRKLELLFRQQLLLHKYFTQADLFRSCHNCSLTCLDPILCDT
jgi:hypothetical protein